ncbi:bifunctional 2-polyprenyl-6-hydroxyphenol methylase/3-demethylubiquinol 3-O-methyltransferase UbiG [uncultured Variovorax sp.]|mgnify:CR=1 FL=1|uniref:class I SAM-dependent methyltransferase n=1 Tax=uncultured Variovorax sp. TaxID=114708 RepID=UPI00261A20FC|nr:class I SAM-dependent methyltransferase [uncultured Variovorax sp.]
MDRAAQLLEGIDVDALVGLEVGPLDKALVKRTEGRQIFYADYADRAALRAASETDPNVNIDAIPEIDYVIAPLPERLPRQFDYVIASHVGEHVPDLLGWLKTLFGWLKPGGVVILALPDKRYTFDCLREHSTIGELLEAHVEKRERPSFASIYDGFSKATRNDVCALWEGADPAKFEYQFPRDVSFRMARDAHINGTYRDCHCWVFTAHGFRALLDEARDLGVIDFDWVRATDPETYTVEFYVTIRPRAAH